MQPSNGNQQVRIRNAVFFFKKYSIHPIAVLEYWRYPETVGRSKRIWPIEKGGDELCFKGRMAEEF